MSLTDAPLPSPRSYWTEEFSFARGLFDMSAIPIRYFATTIPIASLPHWFTLIEDIPGSEKWGYRAIFQRDIDDRRVREELLDGYLLKPDKFKFFPSLTIGLLPYDAETQHILDAYRGPDTETQEGRLVKEAIDGIEITTLAGASIGTIRWDTQKIRAVALDGQHRLSALVQLASAPPAHIDPAASEVPLLLLVFDQKSGSILAQIREIFIDINKTAEPVSKSRQILLDDRDPFAVMARDLIQDESGEEGIPYEVIDYKGRETLRPEAYQLTTILVLYQCVRRMFASRTARIDSELDVNSELQRRQLKQIDFRDRSCVDNRKQEELLLERFRSRHKKFVTVLFGQVSPYRDVVTTLAKLLDQPHGDSLREYLLKPEPKRLATRKRIEREGIDVARVIDAALDALERAKDAENLLVFSVGQRALFYWFSKVHVLYRDHLQTTGFGEIAEAFVADLNSLCERGFFRRHMSVCDFRVWEGLCVQGGTLLWSDTAAARLGAMILLAVAAMRWQHAERIEETRLGRRLRLSPVVKRIVQGYKPLIELASSQLEDGSEDNEDGEDDVPDDDGGDDEAELLFDDEGVTDYELQAKKRLYDVLTWVLER